MINDNKELKKIAKDIREGALIIYPTETSYGLGCNILDEKALNRIYTLKKREKKKYLTCIVSDINMASKYCSLNKKELEICRKYMPDPLTLIAKKKANVPDILNKDFVFRIPGSDFARKLCKMVGFPLVSTSANIAGGEEPYSIDSIPKDIKDNVEYIVNAGILDKRKPSTIITLRPKFKVLRQGDLKIEY